MSRINVCNFTVLGAGDMGAKIAAHWADAKGPASRLFNKSGKQREGVCNG